MFSELGWAEIISSKPPKDSILDNEIEHRLTLLDLPWNIRDKATQVELLLVPAGGYTRGSPEWRVGVDNDECPQHTVNLSKPFYLGRYPLTQSEWANVMGSNPSVSSVGPTHPVESISWHEATAFCQRASFRLPTEAEWEYACRGTVGWLPSPLDSYAWLYRNSGGHTHSVGSLAPNSLGFFDQIGNVLEWCLDWYSQTAYSQLTSGVVDPLGPESGTLKASRGGSWFSHPSGPLRTTARYGEDPSTRADSIGFRVARSLFRL